MSGSCLLDTNIVIEFFKGSTTITDHMGKQTDVFVPSIVIGELYYGAFHSGDVARHLTQVRMFAGASKLLTCDQTTAEHYGSIKHALRVKGRPIPENDIWIAAIAMQYTLTVITRDLHFKEIEDLSIDAW